MITYIIFKGFKVYSFAKLAFRFLTRIMTATPLPHMTIHRANIS